jgi:ABC-2 type transport system ATP-binding protein
MLNVRNVTKRYGDVTAVDSLSFSVSPGKIYGLIGPNGAGKSTSIRMIMNILAPDTGSIELEGKPFADEDRNRIGYLPEERGLYKKQTLIETLLYLAALKGCPSSVAQGRVDPWLERFGLSEYKNKKLDSLSKGMSQKAQFIATVLHEPDLVFLDEPFSGLDPVSADELLGIIRELKDSGKLVLFSTHVMEQAEKVCDHIIMLDRGKKILDGDLREIKRSRGTNSVSVVFADGTVGGREILEAIPAAAEVVVDGDAKSDSFTVALAKDFVADDVFVALAGKASVRSFAVNEPSLHSIFVSLARGGEAVR